MFDLGSLEAAQWVTKVEQTERGRLLPPAQGFKLSTTYRLSTNTQRPMSAPTAERKRKWDQPGDEDPAAKAQKTSDESKSATAAAQAVSIHLD